jgi:flagellar hook-associated protein 2
MSINPSSAFQFSGVMSGLNTTSIIQAIMSQNSLPLQGLQQQQSKIQARDAAYQAVQTQVTSFQSALQTLLTPQGVTGKTVASSSSDVASATADPTAVNGSFTLNVSRLATATTVSSSGPISAGVRPNQVLTDAGFATTPTAGTFTVNGATVQVDATDTLNDVLNKLTDSSAGGSGTNTGVVASIVNDANGNPSFIQLTPIAGNTNAIQLGSASDTSNFLTAANLVATGVTGGGSAGAVQSGQPLGETLLGSPLSSDTFQAGNLGTDGSFVINGTTVNWTNKDSLSTLLNRINSSGAGVTATYDPLHDSVTFANKNSGNQAISLSETANGGIGVLQALGLSNAQQQYGQTAAYTVTQNGVTSATQYSNSNTIVGVPGVSATLTDTGTTTVTVSQDTQTAVNNAQNFVNSFNKLMDLIDKDTAYNSSTKTAGVLAGDSGIQDLENRIRSMVSGAASGVSGQYTTLASLGISTGAFGAAAGSTNHLTLDTAKLTTALQNSPDAVSAVLGGGNTATLNGGQPGNWISSYTGTPYGDMYGTYKLSVDDSGNVTSIFSQFGSTPGSPVNATVAAGGSLAGIVPGLTFSVGSLPSSGSVTDTLVFGQSGVLGGLNSYLSGVLGNAGMFANEHTSSGSAIADLNTQITNMNNLLSQQQQSLQNQFTAMESALAQMQGQNASLLQSLGASSSSSSSSGN